MVYSVKVLVLFYSTYGHVYRMAEAGAEGARYQGKHIVTIAKKLMT
jgi:multimeric flavodoxin WrbA